MVCSYLQEYYIAFMSRRLTIDRVAIFHVERLSDSFPLFAMYRISWSPSACRFRVIVIGQVHAAQKRKHQRAGRDGAGSNGFYPLDYEYS